MELVVAARALVYIGATSCDFIEEGAVLLQFNVLAKVITNTSLQCLICIKGLSVVRYEKVK